MSTKRAWSTLQTAIFDDAARGTGHTVVRARAGTGKTTVIVEALHHVPEGLSVLVVAFNVKIRDALTTKQKEGEIPPHVVIKTCHGFGFSALTAKHRSRLSEWRTRDIIDAHHGTDSAGREYRAGIAKAVSLAKGSLAGTEEEIGSMIGSMIDIGQIDDVWSADDDEVRQISGFDIFVGNVLAVLRECQENVKAIDFDDMCWLPVALDLPVRQYDRVFVDETQDLNATQIELVLRACKGGGRICAVGDDRQAIYGFRGAAAGALDRVIDGLGAKVLPLSITYRCASSIVTIARRYVSDYRAAPDAPAGEVITIPESAVLSKARAGDFVISRKNAPLMGLCLAFIRAGVPASVAGRDIGKGLRTLVDKSEAEANKNKIEFTLEVFKLWLDIWRKREIDKLSKRKDADAAIEAVQDRAACLVAIVRDTHNVAGLKDRLSSLFEDRDDERRIVCTTVHKAKGLERRRAFVLADTFRNGQGIEEEDNLFYVAVTRAQSTLFLARESAA